MSDLMRCPTVKIVSPESPGGYIVINESDRAPHHELWNGKMSDKLKTLSSLTELGAALDAPFEVDVATNEETPSHDAPLRVAKGPRGKFYVKRGTSHIEGPFDTEEEAEAALNGPFDR